MLYSTSSYSAMEDYGDAAYFLKRQLLSTAIGMVVFVAAIFINYHSGIKSNGSYMSHRFLRIACPFTIRTHCKGARRWLRLGPLSLQPAEVVKVGLIIVLAAFISYSGSHMKKLKNNIVYCILAVAAAGITGIVTNNLSTAIILMGIAYIMLMIGNSKPAWLIIATVLGAVAVVAFLIWFLTMWIQRAISVLNVCLHGETRKNTHRIQDSRHCRHCMHSVPADFRKRPGSEHAETRIYSGGPE